MNRRAFTLVELLVVIAIIGLLSTVAVVSLNTSRAKARDAKRLGDLRQFAAAINLYYEATGTNPQCLGAYGYSCTSTVFVNAGNLSDLDISPTYMGKIPSDPKNIATQYGYYYVRGYKPTGSCTYAATGLNTDYMFATRLENPTGVSGSCPGGFSAWDNASLNYLIGN